MVTIHVCTYPILGMCVPIGYEDIVNKCSLGCSQKVKKKLYCVDFALISENIGDDRLHFCTVCVLGFLPIIF